MSRRPIASLAGTWVGIDRRNGADGVRGPSARTDQDGAEAAIATLRAPVRSAVFSGGKAASAALPPCSISLAALAMVSVGKA